MHIIWNAQVQQKMFAKNRCRVASFSLRCLRLSERFSKDKIFAQNRKHSEVRRYLQFQMDDLNEDH